ncbi:MAG: glycosyltransferase [Sedimentisphaerales bacterium]|nr:glycosyltransferase [Sedimentisphaerales bacterium]
MLNSSKIAGDFGASATPEATWNGGGRRGPLVSVLLPTFNRRRYLAQALASVVQQTHRNLEIFVINDGGEDVGDVVRSSNDSRVVFIDRKENRGKPHCLNEALAGARGKYVAYLDDDDIYYPHHVEHLVAALENGTDCRVAYSDLYKSYCNVLPDGSRQILSKHVEISRDFDRFLMLYFNHALHVSLMHRRDLLDRTGPYNESLTILIDWDMTRRLAFFSNFQHVSSITGEFYSPVGASDRISFQQRRDAEVYLRNILAIRTTRPAKPWPKIADLAIILLVDSLDQGVADTMLRIWRHTFYPYKLYLPLLPAERSRLNVEMPNVVPVRVESQSSPAERVDVALQQIEADYVAIVPVGFPVEEMWVENPLYALINSTSREGFLIDGAAGFSWAAVLRRTDLSQPRRAHPHLSVEASLTAARIRVRRPREEELPFQFDELLRQAKVAMDDGNWGTAARLFESMAERHHNEIWMKTMAARAYFEGGHLAEAGRCSHQVNQQRPTVDTLLLEAKICRGKKNVAAAIHLLERAEQWLSRGRPSTATSGKDSRHS